ncbi:MAG: hypothetical protein NTV49_13440 [Kiritimatiellaeota bacterium]|nr:hypothetical protein [Kiritimatiellota bacterium]
MIQKAVAIKKLRATSAADDLSFWGKRDASERIDAVEVLRRQTYESSTRLQRIARVVPFAQDKRATGRKKDLADLEAMGEE